MQIWDLPTNNKRELSRKGYFTKKQVCRSGHEELAP